MSYLPFMSRLITIVFLSLAAFNLVAQKNSAKSDLRTLHWLKGKWKGQGETGAPFFEQYEIRNDTLIVISYYADSGFKSKSGEATIFFSRDKIWHVYGNSKWILSEATDSSWRFLPVERASNSFLWEYVDRNHWKATIVHKSKLIPYRLERIQ